MKVDIYNTDKRYNIIYADDMKKINKLIKDKSTVILEWG